MANVAEVEIHGVMPFDAAVRLKPGMLVTERTDESQRLLEWLGTLNMPAFGLRIEYGPSFMGGEVNDNGGHMTYYEFSVVGREAVWHSQMADLCQALAGAGCVLGTADMMDLEWDPEGAGFAPINWQE